MRTIVITGIGIITPAGNTANEFFDSVVQGRSALRRITRFDTSDCRVKIGGESCLPDDETCLSPKQRSRLDRTTQMAVLAASAALKDAGISTSRARELAGVFIGSAGGCMETTEALHASHFAGAPPDVLGLPMMMGHSPTAHVSMTFGLLGPSLTVSTACSSGAAAIGVAFRSVAAGECSWALAAGPKRRLRAISFSSGAACARSPAAIVNRRQRFARSAARARVSPWVKALAS